MKKLICAKDVESLMSKGEKVFYVDGSEIITPSAKDIAKNNGIIFTKENCKDKVECLDHKKVTSLDNIDAEMMLNFFRKMMDKGLMEEMINCLNKKNLPFEVESAPNGLKVVRGSSVKMDIFDTGNPDSKVYFQELVSKEESKMSAGFLIIDNSKFDWELTYEEIDYVIEGSVTVKIDGKEYTAYAGDVLFVPSGSKVVWSSKEKARIFYTTYPANWPDLLEN
ncbi:cupin domain-containing protein [Clostridium oceanicum]|uniref:Cupin domain-containing protein n=1 Tax=Clostridium oceanicum TaxID=1543 RepID=A0ABP3UUK1_9CLOT